MRLTGIKTFKFEVCNASCYPFPDDENTTWFRNQRNNIVSPDTIDDTINDFIVDKDVININIKTVEEHYHNNGRGNTVTLWVIIHYML